MPLRCKSKIAVGGIDSNSEEDHKIDVHACATPGDGLTSVNYKAVVSKRLKVAPTNSTTLVVPPAPEENLSKDNQEGVSTEKPAKKQV